MIIRDNPQRAFKFQEAIVFLVNSYQQTGKNDKAVIFHSIRVGLSLDEDGYNESVVIAGFLHDLIEDSNTSLADIRSKFGEKVANLVEAVSFDKNVSDKWERFMQTYNKSIKIGKNALVIKAADILDNSNYFRFTKEEAIKKILLKKYKYFLDNTFTLIGDERVWKDLNRRYKELDS